MNDADKLAAALESAPLAPEQAGPADAPADDLSVLVPDVAIEIGGEKLTVRELRFGEQIRHAGALRAIAAAIEDDLRESADPVRLLDALAARGQDFLMLAGLACGKPAAWIEALSGEDGEALSIAFWQANQGFFLRRLVVYPAAAAMAAAQAGLASSPPSSATATGETN
jgi:hypothetical protein